MSSVEDTVRKGFENKHPFFSVDSRHQEPVTISLFWDGYQGIIGEIFLWVGQIKRYESSLLDLDDSAEKPVKIRLKNCETGTFVDAFRMSKPETLSKLRLTFSAVVDDSTNKQGLSTSFIESDIDIPAHPLLQGNHYNLIINGRNCSVKNPSQEQKLSASFISVEPEPEYEKCMASQK